MNLFVSCLLTLAALSVSSLLASDGPPTSAYTYKGEVAGVVCSVCSNHVTTSLSKLPGVTSVKITIGKDGALPTLTVISSSPDLTKEAAIKALGKHGKNYKIMSLRKEPPQTSLPGGASL